MPPNGCGDDQAKRAELRASLSELTHVEALSKTAFLLKAPGGVDQKATDVKQALVQVEVVKPALSAEAPEMLRQLITRSLADDTEGTWFCNDRFVKKTVLGACDAVVEVVYPADGRDIYKRKTIELIRFVETPQLYTDVTVPRLIEKAANKDAWVANIIEGKKEQEHVVAEFGCDQVLIVKDYKWQDTSNTNDLYYLALFKDMTVRSLRDLTGSKHGKALRRIKDEVLPGLALKHDVPTDSLMAYVHYHPTFWYFHIHIVNSKHAMFNGEGSRNLLLSAMDRFHKLDTILALLNASSEYYAAASLPILLQPNQLPWYKDDTVESSAKRAKVSNE